MRRIMALAALVAVSHLAACATSASHSADDETSVGIRREPCGGGPVFPPEEPAAADAGQSAEPPE